MAPNIVKLVKRQAESVPNEAQPTIAAPKIFGHHTPHAKWPVTEAPTEGKANRIRSGKSIIFYINGDELCFPIVHIYCIFLQSFQFF